MGPQYCSLFLPSECGGPSLHSVALEVHRAECDALGHQPYLVKLMCFAEKGKMVNSLMNASEVFSLGKEI